jgi:hypothetical protein
MNVGQILARTSRAALMLALFPAGALAQGASTATPAGQGPMIIERVTSGFLVAPEVKVTRFDRRTSELVGGYAGWLSDQTFFIGGGGYWMANRSRDRGLAYGGLVLGVMARSNRTIGFGVKGLLGGGRATRVETVNLFDDRDIRILAPGAPTRVIVPVPTDVRVRNEFFVAEPEANLIVNLGKRFHLTVGAGYRFTGRERGSAKGISGATGSVALQIGS